MSIAFANKYWLIWFIVMIVAFLVPEFYSLIVGHPEGTLSETIWRLEGWKKGIEQPFWKWNFFHLLFAAELLILDFWLFFHFIFYKFR